MKLSISNIAWSNENNATVYKFMQEKNFLGLEIAPTKIFPNNPYDELENATLWKKELPFEISSMQSIWFGRNEKIFGDSTERETLFNYTKMAIDFAEVIGCKNLVFGCPKNRYLTENIDKNIGTEFFKQIADYALKQKTVVGMEANPTIYNTNYINTTQEALNLISEVDSEGFKLNLDVGTMIANEENLEILRGKVHLMNHVHISEPFLKPIQKRNLHVELAELLRSEGYKNFVSIEMATVDDIEIISEIMEYVRGVFGRA
ncbi:MAG: TIM barrel protein [Selenomonadaceae bacterium]|nr:TIM barrel protein [Selenomonadaceae bacterium]